MLTVGELVAAGVLSVGSFAAGYLYRVVSQHEPPAGPVESFLDERRTELREAYASGEMSRERFAAEIETVEDPATRELMHLARDADGVGPHVAYKVAREFDDVEELAAADRSDLEAINRVGENRARAVLQRARQETGE